MSREDHTKPKHLGDHTRELVYAVDEFLEYPGTPGVEEVRFAKLVRAMQRYSHYTGYDPLNWSARACRYLLDLPES